jgi:competence protein ComEA
VEIGGIVEKYFFPLRGYIVSIIFACVGLIFLGYGLIYYFGGDSEKSEVVFEAANDDIEEEKEEQKVIVVDVAGAVEKPGVYRLADNSRVKDALISAGGLSREADREAIGKSINLASKLVDGGKIYIPFQGDEYTNVVSGESGVGLGGTSDLIDINSASIAQLDSLPGVGQVTADKIVAGRPYESIEVLLERKIVGAKAFEQIRLKIVAQ